MAVVVGGNENESGSEAAAAAAVCDMNAKDVGLAPHASNSECVPSVIHARVANRCYQMDLGRPQ